MKKTIKKSIIIGAVLVVLATGAFFVISRNSAKDVVETVGGVYKNEMVGFSFTYPHGPDGYILQEREIIPKVDDGFLSSVTLTPSADFEAMQKGERVASEGPPTLHVYVLANPKALDLKSWLSANQKYSNLNLKKGEFQTKQVAGQEALFYEADGLYASQNIAFAYDGDVYIINGSFIDRQSKIFEDFSSIVSTFVLTPIEQRERKI